MLNEQQPPVVHFYNTDQAEHVLATGQQLINFQNTDTLERVVKIGGKKQFVALLGRRTPGVGNYVKIDLIQNNPVTKDTTLEAIYEQYKDFKDFAVVGYNPKNRTSKTPNPPLNSPLPILPSTQDTKHIINITADQSDNSFNIESPSHSAIGNDSKYMASTQPQSSPEPSKDLGNLGMVPLNGNTAGTNQIPASTTFNLGRSYSQAKATGTEENSQQPLCFLVPEQGGCCECQIYTHFMHSIKLLALFP